MYRVERLVLGALATNCYLLWEDRHVLIIDPASRSERIHAAIAARDGIVDGIVLTHGHFDHIAGVDVIAEMFHCDVYVHERDALLLRDPHLNLSESQNITVQHDVKYLGVGQQSIGSFTFDVIDAPGHSEGSVMLRWHENLICGDVIFQGSIGRTDFYTSSNAHMTQTLRMVKTLDPDLRVYPGHGESTTIQQELLTNPFLR